MNFDDVLSALQIAATDPEFAASLDGSSSILVEETEQQGVLLVSTDSAEVEVDLAAEAAAEEPVEDAAVAEGGE